jgi:N-acetylglucosaminyl-diphospho-decaprenol L-rhamnosyltransferase
VSEALPGDGPEPGPVALVIVHRNQPGRCVATGRAFLDQGLPVRLIVVDNGSPPEALERVRSGLPDAEVVELGANTGFGPAANAGFRRWLESGAGEWVALAPHDAVPEPGCLARLVAAASARPRAGLASAEYGQPGVPVVHPYLGGVVEPSTEEPAPDGWEAAGHPHGTLMLARRSCLEEIGLFDERYFAYCEEADLGVRAIRAGWEVGIVRGAVVHNPSMSSESGVAEYLMFRNSLLLVRDHFGRYPAFVRLVIAVVGTTIGALFPSRRLMFFHLGGRVHAMADHLRGRYGPPPARLVRASARRRARARPEPRVLTGYAPAPLSDPPPLSGHASGQSEGP